MKYLSFIVLIVLFISCKRDKLNINVSNIEVTTATTRVDKLLFEKDQTTYASNLEKIKNDHRTFFDIYSNYVLKIGTFDSPGFETYLKTFVSDSVISRVADSVKFVFNDFSKTEKQISDGFKHYKSYFPYKPIPAVYTFISGFNQSVITGDSVIGIGLDKYLGADCIFYTYLGIPQYKSAKMTPQRIVPDLFYAIFITEFPYRDSIDNLLSNMIYQGKALYFVEAMCPSLPDSIIAGYSPKQMKWCKQNEASMWTFLVEQKQLYDIERLTLQRYTGDAPFTNTFSNESPGKTGNWIGWRIVQSFMKKNPEVTLPQLLQMKNAQEILSRSGYFPE